LEIIGPETNILTKFLITAFLEESGECPTGFFHCQNCESLEYDDEFDSQELEVGDLSKRKRCIPNELKCNGRDNCASCTDYAADEDDCFPTCPECPESWTGFHDTQYMLTILLAGLFFILSPIVIVLVLFYHKKMNPSSRQREILRIHRERNNAAAHEAISISQSSSQLRNDRPPTYEDVHDTKTPPPNFDEVVVQQTSEVNPEHTSSNISQDISSNI